MANHEVTANVRYIDSAHNTGLLFPTPPLPNTVEEGAGRRRPCHGIKDKALSISNKFREAFGLPTIDPDAGRTELLLPPPHADFRIMPFVPMGHNGKGPVAEDSPFNKEGGVVRIGGPGHFHGMGGPRQHRFHPSFLHRVHRALMILGPWEGRAVAFVLGASSNSVELSRTDLTFRMWYRRPSAHDVGHDDPHGPFFQGRASQ